MYLLVSELLYCLIRSSFRTFRFVRAPCAQFHSAHSMAFKLADVCNVTCGAYHWLYWFLLWITVIRMRCGWMDPRLCRVGSRGECGGQSLRSVVLNRRPVSFECHRNNNIIIWSLCRWKLGMALDSVMLQLRHCVLARCQSLAELSSWLGDRWQTSYMDMRPSLSGLCPLGVDI